MRYYRYRPLLLWTLVLVGCAALLILAPRYVKDHPAPTAPPNQVQLKLSGAERVGALRAALAQVASASSVSPAALESSARSAKDLSSTLAAQTRADGGPEHLAAAFDAVGAQLDVLVAQDLTQPQLTRAIMQIMGSGDALLSALGSNGDKVKIGPLDIDGITATSLVDVPVVTPPNPERKALQMPEQMPSNIFPGSEADR